MAELLRNARSALALFLVCLWFVPGGLFQRLVVWPAVLLRPRRRQALVYWYMRGMSRAIFALFEFGGARFERKGMIPTGSPTLLLMNHQSLLDIITVVMMSDPYSPAFVTRRRYARFIPAVSLCLRLLRAPIIDPRRDPRGALAAIEEAARAQDEALLIFPEGHRTRDGQIRPFKTAGAQAVLRARRRPVYLIVSDGFWEGRRLVDFVFRIHSIRGETEVLGPFQAPADDERLPEFFDSMRETMVAHLRRMRERRHAGVA